MNLSLVVQATNFVLFMAFVMLTIEQHIQDITPATVFSFMAFLTQTLTNFVTYHTAENFTEHSLRFAQTIHESEWYKFPVYQQKMLRYTIERSQKVFVLQGSAIFNVNMELFGTVAHFTFSFTGFIINFFPQFFQASFKYYLMLRQLRKT